MPIDDDKLIEYVLGLLEESERATLKAELASSAELRDRVACLRDSLATPLLATDPVAPGGDLGAQIQNAITRTGRFHGFIDRLMVFLDLPDERVRELLGAIDDPVHEWEDAKLPGVRVKPFAGGPRLKENQCALMRIVPGAAFPRHRHVGHEWGFVLQGEAQEDSGKVYKPGDIVHQAPGSSHFFTARDDKPFVFFVVSNGIAFH